MLLGRGRFTADLMRPGLLHAAFVRSPHAHVVNGQVRGGVTQGVAAALLERVCFDPDGQPVTTTLMDYLAPTAAEMCDIDIVRLQTPSRFSETGAKGMGEGGTIGAPAAVLGAVNDALAPAGVSFDYIPVLPQDLSSALGGVL